MGNPEMKQDTVADKASATVVPAEIAGQAVSVWKAGLKVYFGKNGIKYHLDAIETLKYGAGSVADGLLRLFAACVGHAGQKGAIPLFKGACAHAEGSAVQDAWETLKSQDADAVKPKLSELLPTWSNAKSNILAGAEAKLDITDRKKFPTVSKIATTLAEARKEKGRAARTPEGAAVKFTDKLTAVLNNLTKELAALNPEQQNAAAGILFRVMGQEIVALRTPVTAGAATPEQVQAATSNGARAAAMRGGRKAA